MGCLNRSINIRTRLARLEARFIESDDRRLLRTLCRALQGNEQPCSDLDGMVAFGSATSGLLNVAAVFLFRDPAALDHVQIDNSE